MIVYTKDEFVNAITNSKHNAIFNRINNLKDVLGDFLHKYSIDGYPICIDVLKSIVIKYYIDGKVICRITQKKENLSIKGNILKHKKDFLTNGVDEDLKSVMQNRTLKNEVDVNALRKIMEIKLKQNKQNKYKVRELLTLNKGIGNINKDRIAVFIPGIEFKFFDWLKNDKYIPKLFQKKIFYRNFIEILGEEYFKVYTVNYRYRQPGIIQSKIISMKLMELNKNIKKKIDIYGHSKGGLIALNCLIEFFKGKDIIGRLIQICTPNKGPNKYLSKFSFILIPFKKNIPGILELFICNSKDRNQKYIIPNNIRKMKDFDDRGVEIYTISSERDFIVKPENVILESGKTDVINLVYDKKALKQISSSFDMVNIFSGVKNLFKHNLLPYTFSNGLDSLIKNISNHTHYFEEKRGVYHIDENCRKKTISFTSEKYKINKSYVICDECLKKSIGITNKVDCSKINFKKGDINSKEIAIIFPGDIFYRKSYVDILYYKEFERFILKNYEGVLFINFNLFTKERMEKKRFYELLTAFSGDAKIYLFAIGSDVKNILSNLHEELVKTGLKFIELFLFCVNDNEISEIKYKLKIFIKESNIKGINTKLKINIFNFFQGLETKNILITENIEIKGDNGNNIKIFEYYYKSISDNNYPDIDTQRSIKDAFHKDNSIKYFDRNYLSELLNKVKNIEYSENAVHFIPINYKELNKFYRVISD